MYNGYLGCENLDENTKIWRYLKYDFFEFLLKEGKLWFSRVDRFDDKFEGWYPETDEYRHAIFEMYKSHTYANCWHKKNHESFLMWEVYGNDINNKGIAIQSTFQRLKKSLEGELKLEQYINEVEYIDLDNDNADLKNNTIMPFFRKSKEYDDEHEIRALIQTIDQKEWSLHDEKILIPVRLDELIEKIYLSPHASENTYSAVQDVVKKYGLKIPVQPPRQKPPKNKSYARLSYNIINNSRTDPSGNFVINEGGVVDIFDQNKH